MGSTAVLSPDPVINADDRTRTRRADNGMPAEAVANVRSTIKSVTPFPGSRPFRCARCSNPLHGRSNISRIRRHAYPITTRVASEPLIQDGPPPHLPLPPRHTPKTPCPGHDDVCVCACWGSPAEWVGRKLNPLRSRRSSRAPIAYKLEVGGGMPAPFSEPADRRLPLQTSQSVTSRCPRSPGTPSTDEGRGMKILGLVNIARCVDTGRDGWVRFTLLIFLLRTSSQGVPCFRKWPRAQA